MKTLRGHRFAVLAARFLLAIVAAAFVLIPAAAAQAHDVLVGTDPADGSVVAAVPATVGLTFDHTPIAIGSVVRVQDATGTDYADGPVAIVDNHVTQALKSDAPAGKYTVVWRVVSADGHPIEGTFAFTAGGANTAAGTPPSSASAVGSAVAAPGAAASAGLPTELVTAGAVAVVLVLAFVALARNIRRKLKTPEADD